MHKENSLQFFVGSRVKLKNFTQAKNNNV